MATIDVLLPVKNGHAFLGQALDSVCRQTHRDWRLLVLDHGSSDDSCALAERYAARDRRIEVLRLPHARGLSGLLNDGLAHCDCRYVMRHDADDICHPQRMTLTLQALAAHPAMVAVGGQAEMIDASGRHIGPMRVPTGAARVGAASFFRNTVIHPTVMFDFGQLDRLGARYGIDFLRALAPPHSMAVAGLAEDYFLLGQLAMLGKCLNIPQRLIRYRRHGQNVSMLAFAEQMHLALRISRFLARSFCAMHDLPPFDPAPFCNHGGQLFDVGPQSDFDAEFARMAAALAAALGPSAALTQELRYRRVLAVRGRAPMLARLAALGLHQRIEKNEWYAIKSWLLRGLPGMVCQVAPRMGQP